MPDISNIPSARSKWSPQVKAEFCTQYAIRGSLREAIRATGNIIPESTARTWRDTDWWHDHVAAVREEQGELIRARAAAIVDSATTRTMETIDTADCRTAATVGAIWLDKLRLLDNLPGSIKVTGSLEALAAEFAKLVRPDPKTIEGETVPSGANQAEDVG